MFDDVLSIFAWSLQGLVAAVILVVAFVAPIAFIFSVMAVSLNTYHKIVWPFISNLLGVELE